MPFGDSTEKGVTIRQPSTANFLVDAKDGIQAGGSASNFVIAPPQSLLNGFFTRIGVPEMALEWSEPNISPRYFNNAFDYDVSGYAVQNLTILTGNYTVESALIAFKNRLNDVSGAVGNLTWTLTGANGVATLTPSSGTAQVRFTGILASLLGLQPNAPFNYTQPGASVSTNSFGSFQDLRPYRYIDFVSNELTYNQNLKDATTSRRLNRDVLVRWYFDWDEQPNLDGFGFPILMGYTAFRARRQFNTPKQIKWEPNMPIGQVSFQVYPDAGNINTPINMSSSLWGMTLQVSEV